MPKIINALFILSFLLIGMVAFANDLETQTIRGKVLDKASLEPIEGALVGLLNHFPYQEAKTDANGVFELKNVPLGRHKLSVKHREYENIEVSGVSVEQDKDLDLTLKLEKLKTGDLKKSQIVRGKIVDKASLAPLKGVFIELLNHAPRRVTKTDGKGRFKLRHIPLGRHKILIEHEGYESVVVPGVTVTAAKELNLVLKLEESIQSEKDPRSPRPKPILSTKDNPNYDMAVAGVRSFLVDETGHFVGDRQDPARFMSNYAGIFMQDDYHNNLIIHGNSPLGLEWRLEGLPIPNPSHIGSFSGTGGRINMLNPNIMGNSDVFMGAFPAEYGNSMAGVFDAKLKTGDNKDFNFLLQYHTATGVEAMAEGPLTKTEDGSFIINFRYGTFNYISYGAHLGLRKMLEKKPNSIRNVQIIEAGSVPKFMDLTFKVESPKSRAGVFTLFGMGGISRQFFNGADSLMALNDPDIREDITESYISRMGVIGLKHRIAIGQSRKTFVESLIGFSYHKVDDVGSWVQDNGAEEKLFNIHDLKYRITASTIFQHKFSPKLSFRAGFMGDYSCVEIDEQAYQNNQEIHHDFFIRNSSLIQGQAQLLYQPSEILNLNVGLYTNFFPLGKSYTIEPRVSANVTIAPRHSIYLAYGMHSQTLPLQFYFYTPTTSSGQGHDHEVFFNNSLKPLRAQHIFLGYKYIISDEWRFRVEVYQQFFNRVPVDSVDQTFSILNFGGSAGDESLLHAASLVNQGTGQNAGLELNIEKLFGRGYYGIFSASWLISRYKGFDETARNAAFGNGYSFLLAFGKEFKIGAKKLNIIDLGFKANHTQGRPYTPVDEAASQIAGTTILDNSRAFEERLPDYFRIDFRVGFLFNSRKVNMTHKLYIDIFNLVNWKNISGYYFDEMQDAVVPRYQLPIYFDLMYQIRF